MNAAGVPDLIKSPIVEFIVALLGILIGIVGLVWARRFRVNPRMVYQKHDFFVIGQPAASPLGDIKILFNGTVVPRLVVTQLGVWNAGNTTVRRGDIVASDPLAVSVKDGVSILGSTRLSLTREVNDFQMRLSEDDRSHALLEFDYLDAGDGAVFQIIHTGGINNVKVTGSLRGIPRGLEDWGDLQEWSEQKVRFSVAAPQLIIMAVLIAFAWIRGLTVAHYPTAAKYFDWMLSAFGLFVALVIVSVIAFLVYYSFRTRARITPKALSRK